MALYDSVVARRTVSPAVRTNGTVNGAAVDLGPTGADSGLLVVATGTITDGSHAVALEESDTGSSAWTAIPAARLQGSPPTVVAADDDTQFEVGFTAGKRYVRAVVTTSGATTGGALAAVIVAGEPGQTPVSHA